jgi:hypothetical protein
VKKRRKEKQERHCRTEVMKYTAIRTSNYHFQASLFAVRSANSA